MRDERGALIGAIVERFSDLPGQVRAYVGDSHADLFVRNLVVLYLEHDLGSDRRGRRILYGAWSPISAAMLRDVGPAALARSVFEDLDRHLRPWLYADHPPWPTWDLFPRLSRAWARLRRLVLVDGP